MKNFVCASCGAEYYATEEGHTQCTVCNADINIPEVKKRSYLSFVIIFLFLLLLYSILKDKPEMEVLVTLTTDTKKDSGTSNNVYLTINHNEDNKYLLDTPNKSDRNRGTTTTYQFKINQDMQKISDIKLSIEGNNAWRMREFTIQFISDNQYSTKYIDSKKRWFSEEERDINLVKAQPFYSYNIDLKSYSYKEVPTLPLTPYE